MENKIRKIYFDKANYLVELLDQEEDIPEERPVEREPEDEPEVKLPSKPVKKSSEYEFDEAGDISTETAKAILFTYIEMCVEEGVKERGSEHGLDDIEGGGDIVQEELERIAKQVQNYLKSVQ